MADPVEITDAELRAMALAAGFAAVDIDRELLNYLRGAYTQVQIQTEAALYDSIIAQLSGPPSEATIAAARDLASREAATQARGLVGTELNKLGEAIADGVERGLGPDAIARNLDVVKGLNKDGAKRMREYIAWLDSRDPALSREEFERRLETRFQKELRDRRRIIAQNEQRIAQGQGNRLDAEANDRQWKAWLTVGDDRVEEECQRNEADGWIPIEKAFDGGVQEVPQHVGCRCTVTYRRLPANDAANERLDARVAATASAIEAGAAA